MIGCGGPCSLSGKSRYVFELYALDMILELGSVASQEGILKLMSDHILVETMLMGIYLR